MLKNLDSKALTTEGIIKSYKIDYDSIKHNPMGGIMLTLIINDNTKLTVKPDLENYHGKVEAGGVGVSAELSNLLGSK